MLVHKSDALQTLKEFHSFVQIQFQCKFKVIRSDNALEFVNSCHSFFVDNEITHQTSYVDRPQQNDRVKRKRMHILEIARALRFHSNLPLGYWEDCVITATHIINRLPTPILQNKTPLNVLLGKSPNYDQLKVFGCLTIVSNPLRDHEKIFFERGSMFISWVS